MTKKNRSPKNLPLETSENLEQQVYDALRISGWIFPMTEDDVQLMEERFTEGKVDIPERLRDPYVIFERNKGNIRRSILQNSHTVKSEEKHTQEAIFLSTDGKTMETKDINQLFEDCFVQNSSNEPKRILEQGIPMPNWGIPWTGGGDSRDFWILTLQFHRSRMNHTYSDPQVYLFDGEGPIDRIMTAKRPSRTILCHGFWRGVGPKHLLYQTYLAPPGHRKQSPWTCIKQIATRDDILPSLSGKKFEGEIYLDSDTNGHWHARCEIYHNYLKYRVYRAVELYLNIFRSCVKKGKQLIEELRDGFYKEFPDFVSVVGSELPKDVPDLTEGVRPYVSDQFIQCIIDLHDERYTNDWRELDYEAPHREASY